MKTKIAMKTNRHNRTQKAQKSLAKPRTIIRQFVKCALRYIEEDNDPCKAVDELRSAYAIAEKLGDLNIIKPIEKAIDEARDGSVLTAETLLTQLHADLFMAERRALSPHRIIITHLWKCHDGWANSVSIFADGKKDDAADLDCRRQFALWYRSARTKENAQKRMQQKIAVALKVVGNCDVTEQGSDMANEYFAQFKPTAEHWSSPNGCADGCPACEAEADEQLPEAITDAGEIAVATKEHKGCKGGKSAAHTPGPWSADKWAPGYTVSATDSHYSVCHLEDCNNAEANAHLIAAAPELIHACETALHKMLKSGTKCTCENMPFTCAICACKTAISKAKGN